jgi:hypothetical protein
MQVQLQFELRRKGVQIIKLYLDNILIQSPIPICVKPSSPLIAHSSPLSHMGSKTPTALPQYTTTPIQISVYS